MLRRVVRHQASELIWRSQLLPSASRPTFRSHFSSTSNIIESSSTPSILQTISPAISSPPPADHPSNISPASSPKAAAPNQEILQEHTTSTSNPSLAALLPLLRSQGPHYTTIHIHGQPYLVTAGDEVRLPFLMGGVEPGDVLRLTRASSIGSRDYTLRGAPYINESLFECRAVVMGVEAEPIRIKEKTAQRNRRLKRVKSKHRYTVLRIQELVIKEELVDAPVAKSEE